MIRRTSAVMWTAAAAVALTTITGVSQAASGATAEELESVPGIGPTVAQAVVDALAASAPAPAVNVTTGEILE